MRVGSVGFASDQGIAHLMRDFYRNGVINEVMVLKHHCRPTHMEWFKPGTPMLTTRPFRGPVVDEFLGKIDVLLFMESPLDWPFLALCKQRGVKTVGVSMYEVTPARLPFTPDKWICPSLLDVEYFPGSPFLPIPAPSGTWKLRERARRYLHNGGNLGLRGHKGTRELLLAMRHVKSPLSLTVRAQDTVGLEKLLREVPDARKDPRITIEAGNRPYEGLFDDHDVYVAPEKYNGCSLPLQEALAAGLLIISTNRFPMNTWLPNEPLIPVHRYYRAKVGPPYNEYDEAEVRPEDIAATMDAWFDTDIASFSKRGRVWAEENSWERLRPLWIQELAK